MNEQKVNELLRRYFEGATSLDEERDLQRYFAGSEIHASLETYRPMFTFFAEERAVEPPAKKAKTSKISLYASIITGIAACIAILFMAGFPKMKPDNYVYFVDGQRIYDETAALDLAENKLQLLAASMQTARNSMAAFDILHETGQSLQQLSKISEAFQQVENKLDVFRIGN